MGMLFLSVKKMNVIIFRYQFFVHSRNNEQNEFEHCSCIFVYVDNRKRDVLPETEAEQSKVNMLILKDAHGIVSM